MKNEYKITKDLIKSWAKEYHLHGAANIFLFILWCVAGVVGLSGLIFTVQLQSDWIVVYLYSLLFAIAVFKLFIQRFIVWSKRYKLFCTTYGVTEWMRTTEFLDDEIFNSEELEIER